MKEPHVARPNRRKHLIQDVGTGRTYENLERAMYGTGVYKKRISEILNGKREDFYGHKFVYVEREDA